MRVGIFDSGIGGLSVLHQALRRIPEAEFIYYADEEHVPYGEKTEKQIKGYINEIIKFMLKKQVDAIVIACNTATSVATKEYRSKFPVPIIGMEPAVKQAVELYGHLPGRILVAATPVTIAGDKLHHLLEKVDREDKVDLAALPGLVRFAEKGDFDTEEIMKYLTKELKHYPLHKYKAFVLGCTHFNYFMAYYKRIFSENVKFIDGNAGTIRQLLRKLEYTGGESCNTLADTASYNGDDGKVTFYFSGKPVTAGDRKRIKAYMEQLDRLDSI
ncbi:glutamate racemase [Lachnospiraceae bacterium 42-17]|jgi:glutamate racemase|nr:glutamate racemase [Dorea sp.]